MFKLSGARVSNTLITFSKITLIVNKYFKLLIGRVVYLLDD